MTVPHQADRGDLLWRIHRHFAESKLTSFCLDAGWEISLCLSWNIWLNNAVLPGLRSTGFWRQSQGRDGGQGSLPWPRGAETSDTIGAAEGSFPLLALNSSNFLTFCTAALFKVDHLPAVFKISNYPLQYFDVFFLNSSFHASQKYKSYQRFKRSLLRKYY